MSNWVYSDIVKDHFINPRNVLYDESSFDYDAKGEIGNVKCGDQMIMYIKVRDNVIVDCKWRTYGCASAIASTSMLSEAVKGMGLKEAYNIKPQDIAKRLGGLPENKIHCSVLGDRALKEAIKDYIKKNGMDINMLIEEREEIICKCLNITDKDIKEAVLGGADTYEKLQEMTKIGTVCGQCKEITIDVMNKFLNK
ncbi:MAG TPA: iron-sulfur cluster assembly scaffold protein [Spirochaetota bacterium]|nr:iron-sulfur cluster assembly scaffold protein [Spirochaetota bacterium]HOM38812.1 iron-sulfur cluster assembly scaffold protein [Spirochaetota bacterium]HPQ49870.1 iron-sulfur cluster assembly scaffold protein [Spirochaetota bacterium]